MPDELARQLPYIRKLLEAMRVPILELPGFEADDIIGTLAVEAARRGTEVYIVSGDKDMRQLVRPGIFIFDPMKNLLYDEAMVLEVSGVRPDQIVDMMALQGDAVDNIPGAPGIGAKGAKDLIARFGSLDALLAAADQVERKTYRESLQNNREQILQSRVLVTVRTDVPVPLDLDGFRIQDPNRAAMREFYQQMEFHSLLKDWLPELEARQHDYSELPAGANFPSTQEGPVAVAVSTYEAEAFLAVSARPGEARTLPVARLPELRMAG